MATTRTSPRKNSFETAFHFLPDTPVAKQAGAMAGAIASPLRQGQPGTVMHFGTPRPATHKPYAPLALTPTTASGGSREAEHDVADYTPRINAAKNRVARSVAVLAQAARQSRHDPQAFTNILFETAATLFEAGHLKAALALSSWDITRHHAADKNADLAMYILKGQCILSGEPGEPDALHDITGIAAHIARAYPEAGETAELLALDAALIYGNTAHLIGDLEKVRNPELRHLTQIKMKSKRKDPEASKLLDQYEGDTRSGWTSAIPPEVVEAMAPLQPELAIRFLQSIIRKLGDAAPLRMSLLSSPHLRCLHDKPEWPQLLASAGRRSDREFEDEILTGVKTALQAAA